VSNATNDRLVPRLNVANRSTLLAKLVTLAGLAGLGVAVWQGLALGRAVRNGRALARCALRFETHPPLAHARVLLLGDSTGLGVGSEVANQSLPGLLAAEFPQVEIVNACHSGARVADTFSQLLSHSRPCDTFDLALVLAGGNDVLKLTGAQALVTHTHALLHELQPRAREVVWMGSADIGTVPALKPPLKWVFGWLCRRTMRLLERTVRNTGVQFIDFCARRHGRVFSGAPDRFFARDGLHPSAAAYRHCFEELKRRAPVAALLQQQPVGMPSKGMEASPSEDGCFWETE
jgi:lysophospholipase L1-like esterase